MPHMLKQVLGSVLTPEETAQVYSAFDQIGDIVIIKIPDELMPKKKLIADAILANVKTAKAVFAQVSPVRGDFRVRDLEFIAGENRTVTEYKEHGCRFKVDVAKTYFSPRLSTERQRIADMVGDNETIINMFAGVGTYSVVIAKANKTCKVYSIDSNSAASELDGINAKLNKVQDRVVTICGDAAEVIKDRLAGRADRVLMPLPERAKEFVDSAVLALKEKGIVHYFAHIKADSKKAGQELGLQDAHDAFAKYDHQVLAIRVIREVGPRIYQIVADVLVSSRHH
ncbi:putative methyltransferase [Candidatus Nitrososphaera gargensis Ga9.2]|uniref:tRNA (guanine(37)-N(1))-methyltransferase n=2 Tax=Candidatus Nitrososphaera gargensis TaxID=497727 RepID=K0IML1_NITGG|nr:putative methyltransferase [Candidatus Nitrososphaera gargensis Ga9.2]